MALINFRTSRFDVAAEAPNPINPIPGRSVLQWLRAGLSTSGYVTTEPETEDWGWYVTVEAEDMTYMVGASGEVDGKSKDVDWVVQVHKHRSLKDKLFGRNKLAADDALVKQIEQLIRADGQASTVTIDRDA